MENSLENVVIVTSTRFEGYNSGDIDSVFLRQQLFFKTLERARQYGAQVVVVDDSPINFLFEKELPNSCFIFKQEKPGFGEARRQAIREALKLDGINNKVIAMMEPGKEDYVSQIYGTAEPILEGEKQIIVPQRSSIRSYPSVQAFTEQAGNIIIENITGMPYLDMYFGPKTFSPKVAKFFLEYDSKKYGDLWQSHMIPVFQAYIDGCSVDSVMVDYHHPSEQKIFETGNVEFNKKRLEQLAVISAAFEKYCKDIK